MFGEELIKSANKAGINTTYVKKDKTSASGVGNIFLEVKEGQKVKNRILIIPGANMKMTAEDVDFLKESISEYDIVMLQHEIPMEVNEAVLSFAYEKGVPVMLNPAPSRPLPEEMLKKITYISPNEHEAFDLTGVKIIQNEFEVDIETVKLAAIELMKKGALNVIITLGNNGAAFMNKNKFIYQPCIDIVNVIDPTAAGDSFLAAFCTVVNSGMTEEDVLEFASYTATITVSRIGAQPSLPTYQEVVELMKSDKNSKAVNM